MKCPEPVRPLRCPDAYCAPSPMLRDTLKSIKTRTGVFATPGRARKHDKAGMGSTLPCPGPRLDHLFTQRPRFITRGAFSSCIQCSEACPGMLGFCVAGDASCGAWQRQQVAPAGT